MFESAYEVTKVGRQSGLHHEYHKETIIYRFDARDGERYLIYITQYPWDFHTIDFCRNRTKNSRHKWTELTGRNDAIRVLSTVVHLMIHLLKEGYQEGVSFGFIGARMAQDKEGGGSKRYKVYRKIMLNLIDRFNYIHLEDPRADAYLIVNPAADIHQVVSTAKTVFAKAEEE